MAKKYYWIKLKTDFFNLDEIDFLLSQKNGCEYIVLYEMLCLKTANNDGVLNTRIGEMIIPYDPAKIARDTKYFDIDTVIVAMELFKKLGLIYEEEDKTLKIAAINEMVGSETAWAEKKRMYREKQKALTSGQSVDNVLEEKDIDIRDKSIDKDIDIEKEFNELWSMYPRKQGKTNALKAYTKARKKGTTKEDIWSGLGNYISYIKNENIKQQYIKQGSTWFNQECWKDDYTISEVNNNGSNKKSDGSEYAGLC